MVGLFYAVMSLAALAGGFLYPICFSDACLQLPGVFGRSWFLWGALFYAISAVLCLNAQCKRYVVAFLAGGAALHAALIGYGYFVFSGICPVCWKFAVLDIMLPVLYVWAPGVGPVAQKLKVPARVLPLVMSAILIVNPVAGISENSANKGYSLTGVAKASEFHGNSTDMKPFDHNESPGTLAEDFIVTVSTAQGQSVELNIRQRPALFFAVWCPHCDEALREVAARPPKERPFLIVTYLNKGDRAKVREKLARNGLAGEKYFLAEKPPVWLNMVPTIVSWDKESGSLELIEGIEK